MKSQNESLLKMFKQGYVVDPNLALKELGIARLAARVYDLRQKGIPIYRGKRNFTSRSGRPGFVAVYWMKTDHGRA